MTRQPSFLMTDPSLYDVAYQINPWMKPGDWSANAAANRQKAIAASAALRIALEDSGANIVMIPAEPGVPDLVFPANAAVMLDGKVLLARFRHAERSGEEPHFRRAFERLRRAAWRPPKIEQIDVVHEGAGDCIWDAARQLFWVGSGPRSSAEAAGAQIAAYFGRQVVELPLATEQFYHLDTCFCPLSGGEILYYPPALTSRGARTAAGYRAPSPADRSHREDAAAFCVNAVSLGDTIIMAEPPLALRRRLTERGYKVLGVDLAPFILSGGGAFCMTLRTDLKSSPSFAAAATTPSWKEPRCDDDGDGRPGAVAPRTDYLALESEYGARNYKPLDVVLTRGEGVYVWDVDGKRYLDGLSAYSAVNQGHCHPRILKAMIDQASRLTLTSRAFRNDQLGLFYEEVCKLTGSHAVLPMNTGVEAVESAIKVSRKWGYEVKGVSLRTRPRSSSAPTTSTAAPFRWSGFSTDPVSTTNFGPFGGGFKVVPFGDSAALEAAITRNTVAFLVEPIQGEAGVIIPPAGYLKRVRDICTRHGVILILDEIQTGLGRTGKLLAEEHEGVEGDLTLIGKALSGGFYPVSAVLSNKEVLGVLKPGEHGSTFGGNPLGCAVARMALKVLVDEGMIENAAIQGVIA